MTNGRAKHGANGLVEDGLEALLGERGALQILDGGDLLGHGQSLRIGDRRQLLVLELLNRLFVVAQIELGAHKDDGHVVAMVTHLGEPLGAHVLEGSGIHQREADEEHVRLRIRERAQAIVVLLPGRIPQAQVDGLRVDHHIGRVVVEHGGNILAGEGVGGVADQQARLAHGAVANNNTLDCLHDVVVVVAALVSSSIFYR